MKNLNAKDSIFRSVHLKLAFKNGLLRKGRH